MATVGPDTPTNFTKTRSLCSQCNLDKDNATEFAQNKDGKQYEICQQCHHEQSIIFWQSVRTKVCRACDKYRPITKFEFKDGVPYPNCRECFDEIICTRKNAERVAARVGEGGQGRKRTGGDCEEPRSGGGGVETPVVAAAEGGAGENKKKFKFTKKPERKQSKSVTVA
jgi:hypothetical protein